MSEVLGKPIKAGDVDPDYPQSLERGTRSERALKLALAEMYVQGVSTRRVAAITEQLCGFEISSGQVSRAAQELDGVLEAWRQRPLAACPYLLLDARYEKVRQGGVVQDAAVLIAMGVDAAGKRSVLGVSVALSEQETHWRQFLQGLVSRGLGGVRLIVSDAHEGLKAARLAVFGSTLWQRCQFHLLPLAAERFGPCPQTGQEVAGGGGHPGHLQRPRQSRSRGTLEAGGAEVRGPGPETGRVDGTGAARGPGGVRSP